VEIKEEKMTDVGSIAALMQKGENIECDFTHDDNGNVTTGMVYIAGEQMRGEFLLTQPDGTSFDGNVIRDEEYAYTWGGPFGESKGTKLKISSVDVPDDTASSEDDLTDFFDDDTIQYECSKWNADNEMFIPPSDIEFQDISAAVMEIQDATAGIGNLQCDTCNQIPEGQGREECLKALGC
jgi:hypothetical protein